MKAKQGSYRWLKIGAAGVVGGGALFLTGGLAAPAVGGAMAATGFGAGAVAVGSSTMVIGSVLGLGGAGLAGYKMSKRTGGVEEFAFEHLGGGIAGEGMSAYIFVPGYLAQDDEENHIQGGFNGFAETCKQVSADFVMSGEHYALRWEVAHDKTQRIQPPFPTHFQPALLTHC